MVFIYWWLVLAHFSFLVCGYQSNHPPPPKIDQNIALLRTVPGDTHHEISLHSTHCPYVMNECSCSFQHNPSWGWMSGHPPSPPSDFFVQFVFSILMLVIYNILQLPLCKIFHLPPFILTYWFIIDNLYLQSKIPGKRYDCPIH